MCLYGKPAFIRSGNGAEFTATAVMKWLCDQNIGRPISSPAVLGKAGLWKANGKLRDECLNREWFLTRREAMVVIEKWQQFYNNERPHSVLGNQTPTSVVRQQWQNQSV